MTTTTRPARSDQIADEMMALRGLSPSSAATYSKAVRQLQRWCVERGAELATVTPTDLVDYQVGRAPGRENLKILRSGMRHYYATHPHSGGPDPLAAIRVGPKPRYRCRALSVADASALEATAAARGDRAGAAVLCGLYLALRRVEIAHLRWADLAREPAWVRVYGKGNTTADLPVHPILAGALAGVDHDPSGWVFAGRRDGPVCAATVWTWVRAVAAEAGVVACTHVLRHTALATANDATKDLRGVQELARHARPETTALYTRVAAKRLVATAMAIDYRTNQEDPDAR